MSAQTEYVVASITLSKHEKTTVPRAALHDWVVWQYPRPRDGGLCAAVHPPVPHHGWIPAVVLAKSRKVHLYAHLPRPFESPEAAVEYFNTPEGHAV